MASLLSYALCTVADVKENLGIASSVTQYDNLIIRKINQATLAIQAYCGRHFKATDYSDEDHFGSSTTQIVLRNRPIIGTVAFSQRHTSLNEDDFEDVDSNLFFTDANSGVLDLNFTARGSAGRYRADYRAGYETIPADLAEACASLAAYYFNNANTANIGVSRKKEGQREIQYSTQGNAATSLDSIVGLLGIDGILNSYANYPLNPNS